MPERGWGSFVLLNIRGSARGLSRDFPDVEPRGMFPSGNSSMEIPRTSKQS